MSDENTERLLLDENRVEHIPDWDALAEVVKMFCLDKRG